MVADRSEPLTLDGERGDIAAFRSLDPTASQAKIALVGEMDHFIEEKYDFRLMCIRYLVDKGWRWFGEEIPADRGRRADEYLRMGDESLLDPIDEPPWFTSGILANNRQPTEALDAAQKRFMIRVRQVAPEARWFGFDADATDEDYLALANAADSYEALRPAMARREQIMHEHVAAKLRREPGEKVALFGAVLHLLKDDALVDAPGVGAGPGGGEIPSLGHFVTHELGANQVLSIWMLHGSGRSANPWIAPPGDLSPQPGTYDSELATAHASPRFVYVANDAERRSVTQMHNLVMRCRFAEQVDGIVFVPSVHPISA